MFGKISFDFSTNFSTYFNSSAFTFLIYFIFCVFSFVFIIFSCCYSIIFAFSLAIREAYDVLLHRIAYSSIQAASSQFLLLSSLSLCSLKVLSSYAYLFFSCSCRPSASSISLISIAFSKLSSYKSQLSIRLQIRLQSLFSLLTAAVSWELAIYRSFICSLRRVFSAITSSWESLLEDGRNDFRLGSPILIFAKSLTQSCLETLRFTPLCKRFKLPMSVLLLLERGGDDMLNIKQNIHIPNYGTSLHDSLKSLCDC